MVVKTTCVRPGMILQVRELEGAMVVKLFEADNNNAMKGTKLPGVDQQNMLFGIFAVDFRLGRDTV